MNKKKKRLIVRIDRLEDEVTRLRESVNVLTKIVTQQRPYRDNPWTINNWKPTDIIGTTGNQHES